MNEEAFAVIRASSGKTAAGRLLLGAGVLALLIPAIAGCEAGEDAPTLQFHPASSGAQTVFNGIKITNAFVLGAPTGATVPSGSSASLFVSLYNGGDGSDTLLSAAAPGCGGEHFPVRRDGVPSRERRPGQPDRPAAGRRAREPDQAAQRRDHHPGDLRLPARRPVTLQVPVEAQSYYWSTYSAPASSPTGAAAHSTQTATPVTGASSTATATAGRPRAATATPTP